MKEVDLSGVKRGDTVWTSDGEPLVVTSAGRRWICTGRLRWVTETGLAERTYGWQKRIFSTKVEYDLVLWESQVRSLWHAVRMNKEIYPIDRVLAALAALDVKLPKWPISEAQSKEKS